MPRRRPPALDQIDIKILAALQRDGRSTIEKLTKAVGLSARPCLERVRRLEAAGIIAGYQAVLNIDRLTRPITVFAEITLAYRQRKWQPHDWTYPDYRRDDYQQFFTECRERLLNCGPYVERLE